MGSRPSDQAWGTDVGLTGKATEHHGAFQGALVLLYLSYGALGVIYGDIGTSPLYTLQACFTYEDGGSTMRTNVPEPEHMLAVASLLFWSLTLVVVMKYVFIILLFNDNGEGGTFALYSLLCRAIGCNPYGAASGVETSFQGFNSDSAADAPTSAAASASSSDARRQQPPHQQQHHAGELQKASSWVKGLFRLHTGAGLRLRRKLQSSAWAQRVLLMVVVMTTAMVVGDGVLTPAISVLGAVSGLQVVSDSIQQPQVVGITIAILVLLFSIQHFGTGRVSAAFSPVIIIYFLLIAAVGLYNLTTHGWEPFKAISPSYAVMAFVRDFKGTWLLLGSVMLVMTGAEAMYADLGHFCVGAVRLSYCTLVFPCLIFSYLGQVAYLLAYPEAYTNPFWLSVPTPVYWPVLIVSTLASVVASQALISGVFSIVHQAIRLGVFPRYTVTHTDENTEGRVYIAQVNYALMLGCVVIVAGFQDATALGHAYGVAVISVMFITSFLGALVALVNYAINPAIVLPVLLFYVLIEGLFLSANLVKIPEGGWVALLMAAAVAAVKYVWWYGQKQVHSWRQAHTLSSSQCFTRGPINHHASPAAYDIATAAGAGGREKSDEVAGVSVNGSRAVDMPTIKAISTPSLGVKGSKLMVHKGSTPAGAAVGGPFLETWWMGEKPLSRVRGVGIVYSDTVWGIPTVLQQLLVKLPFLWEVTLLVTNRTVPLPSVSNAERFLIRRSTNCPGMFHLVARYGYMDRVQQGPAFVSQVLGFLIQQLHSGALSSSSNSKGAAQGGVPIIKSDADATTALGAHPAAPLATEEAPARAAAAAATALNEDPQAAEGARAAAGGGGGGAAAADKVLVWSAGPVPSEGLTAGLQSVASSSTLPEPTSPQSAGMFKPSSLELVGPESTSAAAVASGGGAGGGGSILRPGEKTLGVNLQRRSLMDIATRSIGVQHAYGRRVRFQEQQQLAAGAEQQLSGILEKNSSDPFDSMTSKQQPAAAGDIEIGLAAEVGPIAAAPLLLLKGDDELSRVLQCYREGVVYVVGKPELMADAGTAWYRRWLVTCYQLLRATTADRAQAWGLPDDQLLACGMSVRV